MFDRIAPVYDAMNRAMTAGLDQRWRRLAARAAVRPGDRALDACCGTGDLALADLRAGAAEVVGLDFSEAMLERARRKSAAVQWIEGDLLALPFPDGVFDAATAVLEITRPRGLLRPFFRLWFDVLVPLAGRVLPGGEAYTYLPASVRRFPGPEDLAAALARSGFAGVRFRTIAGGIVALHVAEAA
jgi:demethylmenaquinone methyltransferase/2-methoxy-6-polyprenyl-1,4-benzoquinol methylase